MLAHKSADAFDQIAPTIFRVESRSTNVAAASGFSVARLEDSQRLVLATAGHVLTEARSNPCDWVVQQFDRNGKPARVVKFASRPGDEHLWLHRRLDLGILILESHTSDGSLFSPNDEPLAPMIDERLGVTAGTRIGWAGYPGVVEQALGHPHLCYCEGVVSAMIDQADRRLYLVDGHNTYGISGGPVWHWSAERDCLEVVGVVCGYQPSRALPGFCVFSPLDSYRALFESWQQRWHAQRGPCA